MNTVHSFEAKTIPVADIFIGKRLRKEYGDVDSLAKSISEIGLLHSPIVNSENKLIVGFRRYLAIKKLGWKEIPVRISPITGDNTDE